MSAELWSPKFDIRKAQRDQISQTNMSSYDNAIIGRSHVKMLLVQVNKNYCYQTCTTPRLRVTNPVLNNLKNTDDIIVIKVKHNNSMTTRIVVTTFG